MASCRNEYTTWYSTGPIQVIGSNSEVWLFLEFDRIVSTGRRGYDYPTAYPIGHFQDVLVIDRNGLKNKMRIADIDNTNGVTFHPNITRIFRLNDNFYLYSGPSMLYQESLFEWNESQERFSLLEIQEASAVLNELPSRYTVRDSFDAVDSESEASGWDVLYRDSAIAEGKFTWNGVEFYIAAISTEHQINVEIRNSENLSLMLEYERAFEKITKEMFENLPRAIGGHPKDN